MSDKAYCQLCTDLY